MSMFHLIKQQISILDVIQQYTTLKKAGSYWKGSCPFHHEKTASFTVSPHKEIFYCFGCHAGGDVITFIQKVEQCQPIEAIQFLAQRHGIELPKTEENIPNASTQEKNRYFNLCKKVAAWCHENLLKNPSLLSYLYKRGLSHDVIVLFNLGYFPSGFTAIKSLTESMRQYNILTSDLVEANILTEGKNVLYSPFENRIIFPIKDHLGQFCGFGGRIFIPTDERPKYYNSRENNYFFKGQLLFGFDLAKKAIQQKEIVFLVEGYTDCLAMVQHGFTNTVATLGTACTLNHLKTLSRHARQMYIVYDNDNAGNAAILRLTELCWQVDLELNVITLPQGQDPASFLAITGNNLQQYIDQACDIFIFFIESLSNNFEAKLIPEKIQLIRKFITIIGSLEDSLKQNFLLQKASKSFNIPFDMLTQELNRIKPVSQTIPIAPPAQAPKNFKTDVAIQQPPLNTAPQPTFETVSALEKKIFCAIMKDIHILNDYRKKYLIECMPGLLRNILQQLQQVQCVTPDIDFSQFFSTLDMQQQQYIGSLLINYEQTINKKEFELLVLQLQQKKWKILVNDIKTQLGDAQNNGDSLKIKEIVDNFLQLKQQITPATEKVNND